MARVARTSGERKIKREGRMARKCARLLSGGRPSAITDAIQPSRRKGRLRAVARWCKTVLPMVLSTGLVNGIVLALCSMVRPNTSRSAPLGLYRMVDQPVVRGVLVVACVPPAAERARLSRRGLLPGRHSTGS